MKTTKKRSRLRLAVSVGFLAAALSLPPAGAPLAKESPPAASSAPASPHGACGREGQAAPCCRTARSGNSTG